MKIPGIHNDGTRKVVHLALDHPDWTYKGVTKGGHGCLCWTPTGECVYFGFTPGDGNAWKPLARDIERISGVVVHQRTKRRPPDRSQPPKPQPVALQRARATAEATADARERRRLAAKAAEAQEKWRRQLRDLMMPGR